MRDDRGDETGDDTGGDTQHVRAENYVRTRQGTVATSTLAFQVHDHLVATCPVCRRTWQVLAASQEPLLARLRTLGTPATVGATPAVDTPGAAGGAGPADTAEPCDEHSEPIDVAAPPAGDTAAPPPSLAAEARRLERLVAALRGQRDRARRDLWRLRRHPLGRRPAIIRTSRTRYRSRAFAERLLAESRACVRTDPVEAESLAGLVADELRRIPGAADADWRRALAARGAAHQANALRVAGDLTAAAVSFVALRRQLAEQPVADLATLAEVASLEASLYIDQRRAQEAEALLAHARFLSEQAGDAEGEARVLLQQGMLHETQGRFEESLAALEEAAARLDPERHPYMLLATVNSRVIALCELGRATEASDLLAVHCDLYERSEDAHVGCVLRGLQGRVASTLGRFREAGECFDASRDGLLALGRTYDAALAALDLAGVYLEQARWDRLLELSAQLARQFRGHGVARETLAALDLLRRSVTSRELTHELIGQLRSRFREPGHRKP